MKCEMCRKNFNREDEKNEFEYEMNSKNYDFLKKKLCAQCAIEIFEDLISGVYFEICDNCEKEYDFIEDNCKFENRYTNEYGNYATIADLTNGKSLCFECAIEEYEKENDE